jgi:hypothetical protein
MGLHKAELSNMWMTRPASSGILRIDTSCRLITYLPTYCMEQSPSWEAHRFTGSQKISFIWSNPKVHYCIY